MYRRSFLAFSLAVLPALSNGQSFTLVKDYSGQNFFSGFTFNASAIDYNNFGNVHFVSQSDAVAQNLTYVDSNNHVIIRVDNTTVDANAGQPFDDFGRNTVYLMSNDKVNIGSLVVFDANHVPFGCSVWPGLFTQGAVWPQQGEIDIIENVNLATSNQYALHVGYSPCNQPQSVTQTGHTSGTNCTVEPLLKINTAGCVVVETQSNSFGQGFASNGGGVYTMLWNEDGISMWFFPRQSIPSDISATGTSPNPSGWGTPSAFYPASGCSPTAAFGPQIITLYTDICGAFAGADTVFPTTCGSVAPNCSSLVANPRNYDTAYWDINYLRVFSSANNTSGSSSSSSGASPSGTSSSSSSSPSSGSNGGSGNTANTGTTGGSGAQSILGFAPTALMGLLISLVLASVSLV